MTDLTKEQIDKIISMSQSYCDHKWENGCCGCAMDSIYCSKCEKSLNND